MKRIWLENYRCFRERQEARLAPLRRLAATTATMEGFGKEAGCHGRRSHAVDT